MLSQQRRTRRKPTNMCQLCQISLASRSVASSNARVAAARRSKLPCEVLVVAFLAWLNQRQDAHALLVSKSGKGGPTVEGNIESV
mmetsp:Transcript_9753/g.25183  ORF Transcript_9753/g.25183 Transcript_9753/m.25183 type:complete len:85 (-) Transcript_9753:1974-2228(-)